MRHKFTQKRRKEAKAKMAEAFAEELSSLPRDLKEMLLDDLVTAFQNRLWALAPWEEEHSRKKFKIKEENVK